MDIPVRIMALDIGQARIGIAVSDELYITAQPLETYARKNIRTDIEYILNICQGYNAGLIVCGLPLDQYGREGAQAVKTREFAKLLEDRGCKIAFIDERYTSKQARQVLISGGAKSKKKGLVDKLAAVIILQTYMQANKI